MKNATPKSNAGPFSVQDDGKIHVTPQAGPTATQRIMGAMAAQSPRTIGQKLIESCQMAQIGKRAGAFPPGPASKACDPGTVCSGTPAA
jgi:hypothetical protein